MKSELLFFCLFWASFRKKVWLTSVNTLVLSVFGKMTPFFLTICYITDIKISQQVEIDKDRSIEHISFDYYTMN